MKEDESGGKQNGDKQLVRLSRGGRNLSPAQDMSEEGESDITDLEARIAAAKMPEDASKVLMVTKLGEYLLLSMIKEMKKYYLLLNFCHSITVN